MISSTLVQFIEDHTESICARIVRKIRRDSRLSHAADLTEVEIRERAAEILKHLGEWLTARERELTVRFESIGRRRFEEGLPLCELVLCYLVVKEEMIDALRDRGLGETVVQLYAEEELEHSAGRFFDSILYHMVKGYEEALHESAPAHALRAAHAVAGAGQHGRKAGARHGDYNSFGSE